MKKGVIFVENLERAIKEKYGENAVKDPRSLWSEEKEKEYLKQKEELLEQKSTSKPQKQDKDGFLVTGKLLNIENQRTCPICDTYSFKIKDDIYLKKFECCYDCFIQHVEGREERWEEKKRSLLNDTRKT